MIQRFFLGMLMLLLSGRLVLPVYSADSAAPVSPADQPAAAASQDAVTRPYKVSPGPLDGQIAYVTAKLLEQLHYLHQPFDETVSSKFLDRYLEALDPQHLHFIQADLEEFAPYRTNLDHLTKGRNVADTHPACEIFQRFVLRLQQRVAYAEELLKTEKFTFDSDKRIAINRHELSYPKDMQEAKALWRDRLRFEYLQEKFGKLDARKKAQAAKNKPAKTAAPATTKPKSDAEEIVDTLNHRYHRQLRFFTDWNNDDVLQIYLTTLAHVYDPHSDYFGHAQLESFSISMNLSLFGIGAELVSEDGYCKIRRLLPGGPAIKSKEIKENDRIVAVAQGEQPFVDVVDMNLTKAVQLIRGPKGTEVSLKMIPADGDSAAPNIVTLIRDEIKLEDQEAKAKIIDLPNTQSPNGQNLRLGVIDLPSFYAQFDVGGNRRNELAGEGEASAPKSTTADVARLLKKLKEENVSGVILDLRRNGGGSLEEAIKLTGLFIKEGPVVQVKNFDGKIEQDDDTDPSIAYAGPLIVLTSKFSASASEILAGALQDYGRALIVGDASTHGKGTVQSVNLLSNWMRDVGTHDPGALKLTIKKFYRASGVSTQLKGVVPDIILPSVFKDSKEVGESALDNPLACDSIDSAKFERLNLVGPYLTDLQKRSAERVSSEREYDYVREDIQQYKKLQADKTVSLNEKQRLKEKEEIEARQKARDKERLARKDPLERVYELSLKQCDLPGLPPPVEKTNSLARVAGADANGSATNLAAVPAGDTPPGLPGEDSEDEKPPVPDASLVEAEHILADYVSVLPKDNVLTAAKPDTILDLNRKN